MIIVKEHFSSNNSSSKLVSYVIQNDIKVQQQFMLPFYHSIK